MKRVQVGSGLPPTVLAPERRVRSLTPADLPAVRALLERSELPVGDLGAAPTLRLWIVEERDQVIGGVGLERYGSAGLLRSLAVSPSHRRQGLGRVLVATVEREALTVGVTMLVLLTQTAVAFFTDLGYRVVDRALVPVELRESTEFRSLCPASAICMTKRLRGPSAGEAHG